MFPACQVGSRDPTWFCNCHLSPDENREPAATEELDARAVRRDLEALGSFRVKRKRGVWLRTPRNDVRRRALGEFPQVRPPGKIYADRRAGCERHHAGTCHIRVRTRYSGTSGAPCPAHFREIQRGAVLHRERRTIVPCNVAAIDAVDLITGAAGELVEAAIDEVRRIERPVAELDERPFRHLQLGAAQVEHAQVHAGASRTAT